MFLMEIACLDLEGTLVPEIWINFAERTGIDELFTTTREIPDYDELMTMRLDVLSKKGMKIPEIHEVIADMKPMDGAVEFLDWLRERMQIVILSDTFYEFAAPLMKQLGYPTLFCHNLQVESDGTISDYKLRMPDQKREAVKRFHELNFNTIAAGDSYNDTTMLSEADFGVLYCPPQNVIDEFPQYPVTTNYQEMRSEFEKAQSAIRSR